MGYITGWIVVGIVTLGIYKLFELFVGKKERLAIIERMGDKIDFSMMKGKFSFPIGASSFSFSSLKLGSLLLGMGLGLLLGYLICATTIPNYYSSNWHLDDLASMIYGASVLLFGGLGLIIAFIIELKITKDNSKK